MTQEPGGVFNPKTKLKRVRYTGWGSTSTSASASTSASTTTGRRRVHAACAHSARHAGLSGWRPCVLRFRGSGDAGSRDQCEKPGCASAVQAVHVFHIAGSPTAGSWLKSAKCIHIRSLPHHMFGTTQIYLPTTATTCRAARKVALERIASREARWAAVRALAT